MLQLVVTFVVFVVGILCLGFLAGMQFEKWRSVKPRDAKGRFVRKDGGRQSNPVVAESVSN